MLGTDAFVNSWSFDNKVLVIDTQIDRLIDSITVPKQPNSMVMDKNNKLWVLSDGGWSGSNYGQEMPAFTRIDPNSRQVEQVFRFDEIIASPTHLCTNPTKDTLYFIYNSMSGQPVEKPGIYAMSVNDKELPTDPIIPQEHNTFYALSVNPNNGNLIISDALDYMQRGKVFIYSSSGLLTDSITAGIIPGNFCFK